MTQSNSPSLAKRLVSVIIFVIILFAVLALFKFLQIRELIASGDVPTPPTAVTAVDAEQQKWNPRIKAVGSLVASEGVELTSESSGVIKEIAFESGEEVEKGQLLFALDDSVEQAALSSAQATFKAANAQLKRSEKLLKNKYVSQNEIEQQRAAVDLARAQIQSAQVAIDKKNIKAPFAGSAGIRQVSVGDLVSPGTPLVSLQNVDTLYLDFTLPEKYLSQLRPRQELEFIVGNDAQYSAHVAAWDPALDRLTRNVSVRAEVDNSRGDLYPGMFVQVNLITNQQNDVVVIPETAIFYNIYGEAVYVLEQMASQNGGKEDDGKEDEAQQGDVHKDNTNGAQQYTLVSRQVEVVFREDGKVGLTQGVKSGEKVVTSGQNKLFNGMNVYITDDVPEFDAGSLSGAVDTAQEEG